MFLVGKFECFDVCLFADVQVKVSVSTLHQQAGSICGKITVLALIPINFDLNILVISLLTCGNVP